MSESNWQCAELGCFRRDEDCLLPVSELGEIILLPALARPGDEEPVVVEPYLCKRRSAEFHEGTEIRGFHNNHHSVESNDKVYLRELIRRIFLYLFCVI